METSQTFPKQVTLWTIQAHPLSTINSIIGTKLVLFQGTYQLDKYRISWKCKKIKPIQTWYDLLLHTISLTGLISDQFIWGKSYFCFLE